MLSYTFDGDIISLDPIHSPGERDKAAWARFLREFNEWAHERGGRPLLNQSPFVTKQHVVDGVRRALAEAERLGSNGRSRPADGQRVFRRAVVDAVSGFSRTSQRLRANHCTKESGLVVEDHENCCKPFHFEQQQLHLLTQRLELALNPRNVRLKALGISLSKSLVDIPRFLKTPYVLLPSGSELDQDLPGYSVCSPRPAGKVRVVLAVVS